MLEKKVIEDLMAGGESKQDREIKYPVDDLVFRTFAKKFNEEYSTRLLEEQKTLV